jgi:hypothetical protein
MELKSILQVSCDIKYERVISRNIFLKHYNQINYNSHMCIHHWCEDKTELCMSTFRVVTEEINTTSDLEADIEKRRLEGLRKTF